jgi:hypothetical protein
MNSEISNWGDYSNRFLAIVTFLGVLAAIYAGWYARKIYIIEHDRDVDKDRDDSESQARLISGWAEISRDSMATTANFGLVAKNQNLSNQPVYDVSFFWYFDGRNVHQNDANLIPPEQPYVWEIPTGVFSGSYVPDNRRTGVTLPEALSIIKKTRLSITFLDSNNRIWNRDEHGILKEIN